MKNPRLAPIFVSRVNEELQRALAAEKRVRKLSQQSIADRLDVNRSVINRRFLGLENLTARTIAETLWAIGWEPHFEARKIKPADGENEPPAKIETYSGQTNGPLKPGLTVVVEEP